MPNLVRFIKKVIFLKKITFFQKYTEYGSSSIQIFTNGYNTFINRPILYFNSLIILIYKQKEGSSSILNCYLLFLSIVIFCLGTSFPVVRLSLLAVTKVQRLNAKVQLRSRLFRYLRLYFPSLIPFSTLSFFRFYFLCLCNRINSIDNSSRNTQLRKRNEFIWTTRRFHFLF